MKDRPKSERPGQQGTNESNRLAEGMKKIRDLQLELSALEKKEALIKMQKETVLQELRKEKKRALLLLKNSLEQEKLYATFV